MHLKHVFDSDESKTIVEVGFEPTKRCRIRS